jgi:prophage antirepressor-like protein
MTMPMVSPQDTPQVFTFPDTAQQVRSLIIDGEPWWVAVDVCAVLEVGNPSQALRHLDEDERAETLISSEGTPGNPRRAIVSEPGLYSLILRSRKPQAKAFKRWITHEVIPQIRKHGSFNAAPPSPAPKEITSAAGPLPYKEQAEIAVILRPVLPEAYASAMGKVILSRAMGERPELEPSETPLYAATFLAEKGHKPKTVTKFQASFGVRVSNRFFKVHGRRPEKIPGPAGSRIDKVAVYSEDDRPLLDQVYGELRERIEAFEGGQAQLPPAA